MGSQNTVREQIAGIPEESCLVKSGRVHTRENPHVQTFGVWRFESPLNREEPVARLAPVLLREDRRDFVEIRFLKETRYSKYFHAATERSRQPSR